ncbi:MAG: hypothetical protein NTZ05_02725, partial [Chloroflexi bacterium]|nr:hypothetical protein [Chloroflexota bacterium]
PLGELFDWVMTAMRSAVAQLQYEDFLTGGRAGPIIVNDLRSRGLDTYLGIQVLNAQIAQISVQGRIDAVNLDQYAGVRETEIAIQRETMARSAAREQDLQDAINDRDIAKVTELTPALVAQRYPELFRPIVGDRAARDLAVTQMLAELAKMGTIDVRPLLEQMGMPGAAAAPRSLGNSWQRDAGGDQSFASLPPGMGARSASSPWPSALPVSDRIAEEAQRIEQMLGVAPRVVQDGHGYILHLVMSDPTDHASLEIILACPVGYPAAPPQATVVMGGREEHFQNDILRYWTSDHSLAEVVDAIVRFYG